MQNELITYMEGTDRHMPEEVQFLVESVVAQADEFKRTKGEVTPIAFFVYYVERVDVIPCVLDYRDEEQKNGMLHLLRKAAQKLKPDAVVLLHEAALKSAGTREEAEALRASPTSVAEMPGAFECLVIAVETYDGSWAAIPKTIERDGVQCFEQPAFGLVREYDGLMMNFLPVRGTVQ